MRRKEEKPRNRKVVLYCLSLPENSTGSTEIVLQEIQLDITTATYQAEVGYRPAKLKSKHSSHSFSM